MPGVFKAAIGPKRTRAIATGSVFAVPGKVHWIACNPKAPNALWELTDDLNGLSAVVYEHFDTDRHSDHLDYFPPLEFKVGCYVKTFTDMTSLVFSYD